MRVVLTTFVMRSITERAQLYRETRSYYGQVRFHILCVIKSLVFTGSLEMCDLMKKQPLHTNEPSARSEQQSRIVVEYAIYMRQEVVAQLNHFSTLVAIQISRQ